jgi:glutathione synthase/RimK-type ligase-like ATP-grasp enzyme
VIRSTRTMILKILRYPTSLKVPSPTGRAHKPSTLILNGAALQSHLEPDASMLARGEAVFRSIGEIGCCIGPDSTRVYEIVSGRDISEFDLVEVLSHPRPTGALLSTIAEHLTHHARPVVNMVGIGAPTRILQMMRLARCGVPVPRTVYLSPGYMPDAHDQLVAALGSPYIVTTLGSFRADQEWLIDSAAGLAGALAEARSSVMAQQFIPNQGVYRMLVMGDRVGLATGPRALGDRDAHEVSRDPDELLDLGALEPDAQHLAVRAAQAMGYEICAVLMTRHMLDRTWRVIEAHFSPAIGTGTHPSLEIEAYAAYLNRRLETSHATWPSFAARIA